MEILTFEQLPSAITLLTKEVSELKALLLKKNEQHSTQLQEEFLTVKQASELLNLSVPTLYSKISRRELPVMKRGKRLYFSKQELTEYIKSGRKLTNDEVDAAADKYLAKK